MAWALQYDIDLDASDADLTDFDAWIVIPSAVAEDIATACLADGSDVAFFAADGTTALPFERVAYSVTGGAATGVWKVGIPAVSSSTGASIVMKCGDSGASDLSDSTLGTPYDAYTELMIHFRDDSGLVCTDSSGNGNDGTNYGATVGTGKIGSAASFNGSSAYIQLPFIAPDPPFTVSLWCNPNAAVGFLSIIGSYVQSEGGWHIGEEPSSNNFYIQEAASGSYAYLTGVSLSSWNSIVASHDGTDMTAYVGGSYNAQIENVVPASGTVNAAIGRRIGVEAFFSGLLDEVRIDSAARSAAWIDYDYGTLMEAGNRQAWELNLIPYATTGLTATYGTQTTKVALSWDANDMAITYKVYRNTTNSTSGATLVESGVASTTYDDTEAPIGVPLYYFVKATNDGGDSDYSSSALGFRKLDTSKLPDPTTEVKDGVDCINATFDGYTVGDLAVGGGGGGNAVIGSGIIVRV